MSGPSAEVAQPASFGASVSFAFDIAVPGACKDPASVSWIVLSIILNVGDYKACRLEDGTREIQEESSLRALSLLESRLYAACEGFLKDTDEEVSLKVLRLAP